MKKDKSEDLSGGRSVLGKQVGKEAFKLIVVIDAASEAFPEGSVSVDAAPVLCKEAAQDNHSRALKNPEQWFVRTKLCVRGCDISLGRCSWRPPISCCEAMDPAAWTGDVA